MRRWRNKILWISLIIEKLNIWNFQDINLGCSLCFFHSQDDDSESWHLSFPGILVPIQTIGMFSNVESFFLTLTFAVARAAWKCFSCFTARRLARGKASFLAKAHSLSPATEAGSQNLYNTHKLKLNRKHSGLQWSPWGHWTLVTLSGHLAASSSPMSPGSVSASSLLSSHPESSLCAALTAWCNVSSLLLSLSGLCEADQPI